MLTMTTVRRTPHSQTTLLSSQLGYCVVGIGHNQEPHITLCNDSFRRTLGIDTGRHDAPDLVSLLKDYFREAVGYLELLSSIHRRHPYETTTNIRTHGLLSTFHHITFHPTRVMQDNRYGIILTQEHLAIGYKTSEPTELFKIIGSLLSTSQRSSDVLEKVMHMISFYLFVDLAVLWLRDPEHDTLRCVSICNQNGVSALPDRHKNWVVEPPDEPWELYDSGAPTYNDVQFAQNRHGQPTLQRLYSSTTQSAEQKALLNSARIPLQTIDGTVIGLLELAGYQLPCPLVDHEATLQGFGLLLGMYLSHSTQRPDTQTEFPLQLFTSSRDRHVPETQACG